MDAYRADGLNSSDYKWVVFVIGCEIGKSIETSFLASDTTVNMLDIL